MADQLYINFMAVLIYTVKQSSLALMMQSIMDDIFDNMENVIYQVTQLLPTDFPSQISDSIFSGMRKIKDKCMR